MTANAEGSFVVASVDHEMAAEETEYAYHCFSGDDVIKQGVLNTTDPLNIIGFEPIIQERHEAYVHHYIIYGSLRDECSDESFDEIVYVWAPGEGPMSFPNNLGSPLFGDNGFQAFEIEVHYNNPRLDTGIIDNSGVESSGQANHVTSRSVSSPPVIPESAWMDSLSEMGSHLIHLSALPLVHPLLVSLSQSLENTCTCTRPEPVLSTSRSVTQVIREAAVDYWEFDQNGNAAVQQDPFTIQPGDDFNTTCFYNGIVRVFGLVVLTRCAWLSCTAFHVSRFMSKN